jgi:hypothetical protein
MAIRQVVPWFEMMFANKTGQGAVLEKGQHYFISFATRFNDGQAEDLQEYLKTVEKEYSCKFTVLHGYGEMPSIYDVTEVLAGMNPLELASKEEVQVYTVTRKFRKMDE